MHVLALSAMNILALSVMYTLPSQRYLFSPPGDVRPAPPIVSMDGASPLQIHNESSLPVDSTFRIRLGSPTARFSPYTTLSPRRMSPNTSSSSQGTLSPFPSIRQSFEPPDANVEIKYQAPVEDREKPSNVRIPIRLSKKKNSPGSLPAHQKESYWNEWKMFFINAQIQATYDRKAFKEGVGESKDE
ncbi:hypothetical protein Sjap_008267 [Stephania japonica]|uniref:Uncharacterized protein n=1 Tax=Stephania japonica TaxID=461633 RepID=A0AAP0JQR4_9MAGN